MGNENVNGWKRRLVSFDFEVTSHDWLLVIMKYPTDEVLGVFHNDNEGVEKFLKEHDYIYVGYNNKHYDNYILKGVLNNYSPEQIKDINEHIITYHKNGWEYVYDKPLLKLPPTSDLMLDMPKRQGLKELEGNMCMNIQESTIDFNIEHAWTKEEFEEMLYYCKHDVISTNKLLGERMEYLESKASLGELCKMSIEKSLYHTNAQLSAISLCAEKVDWNDYNEYKYPKEVDLELIPKDIQKFISDFKHSNESDTMLKWEGEIAGVPHVIGLGGIHGAIKNYREVSNENRIIVNYDVTSYYPSMMIQYGYLSRNIIYPMLYENYYHERLEAKKNGDKKKAKGLKLVL